ncbi:MAG: type II toxin-antitoxin system Phd/YefM family antitoxin [Lachnospiraceae bacterium]|nr:type II toxin-antitoxin system Phd/YefM family antitoxin [Lachnospiraceae bacterium]
MGNVLSAIEKTVPVSLFNRGMAGKIFEDVKRTGAKVVMKNNVAECVLLSPEEYVQMINEINDARLLETALERMENFDPKSLVSQEEIDREFGFTPEMLKGWEEVEIE